MATKNRSVWIIGIAESISGLGAWVTTLAVFSIVVFEGDGGVFASSGIFLASFLPTMLLSPLAGRLVDRFDRRRIMVIAEVLSTIAAVGLAFAGPLWMLYVMLVVLASIESVMVPARQAIIPTLVPREDLMKVNALLMQLASFIKIVGPAVAGLLLVAISPKLAILLDAATFALSAVVLTFLPKLPPVRDENEANDGGRSAWGVIVGEPQLLLLFGAGFFVIALIISFDVMGAVLTRDLLQAGEGYFGLMIGTLGVGNVIGIAMLMLRKHAVNAWNDILLGIVLLTMISLVTAIATLLPSIAMRQAVIIVGSLLGGIGGGMINVQVPTLIQTVTPKQWLGRVSGLFQSTIVAGQLVAMLAVPLLVPGVMGIGVFFAAATGVLFVMVGGIYVIRRTDVNRLDREPVGSY